MSTESFELAIFLTSMSFTQLFQSLRNTSHFARSNFSPCAPLALSTVKFGCQRRVVARTQPSQSLCYTFFFACLSLWYLLCKGLAIHLNANLDARSSKRLLSLHLNVCFPQTVMHAGYPPHSPTRSPTFLRVLVRL
ncbi:hypothetical protein BHM03_00009470 [Ensete ventricosum]|nr:hypothetical protein BHM03_00009470 [Ensete ventricosum]